MAGPARTINTANPSRSRRRQPESRYCREKACRLRARRSSGSQLSSASSVLPPSSPRSSNASETSNRYHHLDHAGQFFTGALVGLLLGSQPAISRRLGDHSSTGLAAVLIAPTVMMLVMVPRFYEPLEPHPFEHALYHLAMAACGLATGLGATRLGLVTGRLMFSPLSRDATHVRCCDEVKEGRQNDRHSKALTLAATGSDAGSSVGWPAERSSSASWLPPTRSATTAVKPTRIRQPPRTRARYSNSNEDDDPSIVAGPGPSKVRPGRSRKVSLQQRQLRRLPLTQRRCRCRPQPEGRRWEQSRR